MNDEILETLRTAGPMTTAMLHHELMVRHRLKCLDGLTPPSKSELEQLLDSLKEAGRVVITTEGWQWLPEAAVQAKPKQPTLFGMEGE